MDFISVTSLNRKSGGAQWGGSAVRYPVGIFSL